MNRGPQKIPPEVLQRLRAQQAAQQRGLPITSDNQPLPSREQNNPIPEGDEGLQILRRYSDCPIPEESNRVNQLIQRGITLEQLTPEAEQALGESVVTILRATRHCATSVRARTMCIFAEDEELAKMHEQLKVEQEKLTRLQDEVNECISTGQALLERRWETAVKKYGLNPEKYSYRVNEEKGVIELVDLDCASCKGPTALRKTRQELADAFMRADLKKEPSNDSDGKDRHVEAAGQQENAPQQEVHLIPADGAPAGGNGDPGPQVAT